MVDGKGINHHVELAGPEIALVHRFSHIVGGDRTLGKGFRFDLPMFPSVIELLQCIQATSCLQFGVALSLLQSSRLKPSSVLVSGQSFNDASNILTDLTNIRRS